MHHDEAQTSALKPSVNH